MSERINITIPDDLHARLQKVREKLNVSSVCQQSLELAVSIEEARMNGSANRKDVVQRLRLQRKQFQDEWFQEGKRLGLEEATEGIDYQDFVAVNEAIDARLELSPVVKNEARFHWISERASELECPTHALESFYSGVFEGINSFWISIANSVVSDNEKWDDLLLL